MSETVGKRAAHKIATRSAIQRSADQLFASQGYADTTVRQIADAAGVTERTFFRYFSGKESLLVAELESQFSVLTEVIRDRPADEEPHAAVVGAIEQLFDQRASSQMSTLLSSFFADGPPAARLGKPSPGLLLSVEQAITDGLTARELTADTYRLQVLARCAVAVLRSAAIRHWELGQQGDGVRPDFMVLVRQGLALLR